MDSLKTVIDDWGHGNALGSGCNCTFFVGVLGDLKRDEARDLDPGEVRCEQLSHAEDCAKTSSCRRLNDVSKAPVNFVEDEDVLEGRVSSDHPKELCGAEDLKTFEAGSFTPAM